MKKCPMMFSNSNEKLDWNCIGAQCAAYVDAEELTEVGDDKKTFGNKFKRVWSCAMMYHEVWHDVEDTNA